MFMQFGNFKTIILTIDIFTQKIHICCGKFYAIKMMMFLKEMYNGFLRNAIGV